LHAVEASEATARDILEEHALDGRERAELEHLLLRRLRDGHATSLL
jgi:hypothetical protein